MPLINAGGLSVHAQILGDRSPDGAPVIMIHGLLVGSLAGWYFGAASSLAGKHQVILYDLRGHGRSEKTLTGYDLAGLSRDLDELIKALDLSRPINLVGHSYGALIALRWALDHPGATDRLVLVEPPIPPSSLHSIDALAARTPQELLSILPESLQSTLRSGGRRAGRFLKGITFLLTESSLLADLQAEPDFSDQEPASLDIPVLAVFGRASPCYANVDRIQRILPNVCIEVLDGGHFLPMEQTLPLTELIAGFLDE